MDLFSMMFFVVVVVVVIVAHIIVILICSGTMNMRPRRGRLGYSDMSGLSFGLAAMVVHGHPSTLVALGCACLDDTLAQGRQQRLAADDSRSAC